MACNYTRLQVAVPTSYDPAGTGTAARSSTVDILRTRSRGHVGVRVVIELSYVLREDGTSEAAED